MRSLPRFARLVFVTLALGASAVGAETEGTTSGAQADPSSPSSGGDLSSLGDEAQSNISQMRGLLSKGLDKLKEARDAKDAVQLTCVNEKVTAMKGILRVSEDAVVGLQDAVSANDTERARAELRKVEMSKRKMDDLSEAAQNCSGATSSEGGGAVEMEVDNSVMATDPYYGDTSFFFDAQNAVVEGGSDSLPDQDDPTVRPPDASGVST